VITERLKAKTVFADDRPVVEYLARGDFELGIQQTNIMVGAPGTEYVGDRCADDKVAVHSRPQQGLSADVCDRVGGVAPWPRPRMGHPRS
jgi:hypothetical protein